MSQFLPGPYATQLLATLGADVVKVEPPSGDPMRDMLCPANQKVSPLYQQVNAGKKIVFADLKTAAGSLIFTSLLETADVLLDGYRPGTLEKLGFGRNEIKELNEKLVCCSLTGYGQTGPYRLRAGHDINYCAMAGLYSGEYRETLPDIPFPLIADHVGGLQAVNTIVAALLKREKTGTGSWLDVSLYETLFSWQYTERLSGMRTMLSGGAAFFNIYRTADGRLLSLGALEEKFWKRFCEALDQPAWIERYHETIPQRELIADVSSVLESCTSAYWVALFEQVDCCLEPIPLIQERMQHPQVRHRGLVDGNVIRYPAMINDSLTPELPGYRELKSSESKFWK
jgi:crotonobetainyl-CoA:carnitine CoA-transferase CaiB-like acyl-CoA transferase